MASFFQQYLQFYTTTASYGQYQGGDRQQSSSYRDSFTAALLSSDLGPYLRLAGLFPPKDAQRPLLVGDADIQLGIDGTPGRYPMGQYVRVPCFPVWASDNDGDLKLIVEWKAPRRSAPANPYYYIHAAWVSSIGRQLGELRKIWMNGELVFASDTTVTQVSDSIDATIEWIDYNGAPTRMMVLTSTDVTNVDLTLLQSGIAVEVSGFSAGGNNGRFIVFQTARDRPITSTNTVALLVPDDGQVPTIENSASAVTVVQTAPTTPQEMYGSFSSFVGSPSQAASSLIAGLVDETDVAAFRGKAGFIVNHLALQRFGNRLPTDVQALWQVDSAWTVGDAIEDIVTEFSELTSADIDVSALTGTFFGAHFEFPFSARQALNAIMLAYNVVEQERDGKIVFFERGTETPIVVADADIIAHALDTDVAKPFSESHDPRVKIPREVVVRYAASSNDYQVGTRRPRRRTTDDSGASIGVDLSTFSLSDSAAMEIANRKLWTEVAAGTVIDGTLPPSYSHVVVNDVLVVTYQGVTTNVRILDLTQGTNGILEYHGIIETRSGSFQSGEDDVAATPAQLPTFASNLRLDVLDIPPLADTEAEVTIKGVYFAGYDVSTRPWTGGTVYVADALDGVYTAVESVENEATRGYTIESSSLSATAQPQWWDNASWIDVRMVNKTPVSKTADEVLRGANMILVGGEVMAFRDAVLQNDGVTYRLSGFLRGLRNTNEAITSHAVNSSGDSERVVWLTPSELNFQPLDQADFGTTLWYKVVPPTVDEALVDGVAVPLIGRNTWPFSPIYIRSRRRSAAEAAAIIAEYGSGTLSPEPAVNDLVIEFTRRSRIHSRLFGTVDAPQDEPATAGPFYFASVFNATTDAFLRHLSNDHEDLTSTGRISSPGLERIVYYASQQTTDGLTVPTDNVKIWIAQQPNVGRIGWPSPTLEIGG